MAARATASSERGVVMLESNQVTHRVLIVDDEDAPGSLEQMAFESTGRYSTAHARNATDALTLLGTEAFDCLVIDLDMPDMSGLELIGMIKARRELENVPIVLVLPDSIHHSEKSPAFTTATHVVSKPLQPWDLTRLVDSLVGDDHQSGQVLSVEAVLRGFPYPTMVLDDRHRVLLANSTFYEATGTGIDSCYVFCHEQMHEGELVPLECPLEQSVRTGLPGERTIDTAFGRLRVSVFPLAASTSDGHGLYLHVTRPADG